MLNRFVSLAVASVVSLSCLPLCARAQTGDDTLEAVATTAMIADVVRAVGGDRVEVRTIIAEGVDPHLYRATRSDMAAMRRADIIFYNGLHLEGKMTDALIAVARGKPVVAITQRIDEEALLYPDGNEGYADPHVWMDPARWALTIDVVLAELSALDPENESEYRARAGEVRAEFEALDSYAESALATIPDGSRVLVTAHDAFNYLADRYQLEVIGIQGISTESEASLATIGSIVDTLVDRRVPAVFVETTVTDRNVKSLIAGAESRGHTVSVGGELFSDAMGPAGTYEGTYVGMIDHNITTIVRALGGSAPEGGMNGRLHGAE